MAEGHDRSTELRRSSVPYQDVESPDVLVRPEHDRVPAPAIKPDKASKKQKDKSGTTQPTTVGDPSKPPSVKEKGFFGTFVALFKKTKRSEMLIPNEAQDVDEKETEKQGKTAMHKLPEIRSEDCRIIGKNQDKWIKRKDKTLNPIEDDPISMGTEETTLHRTDPVGTGGDSTDEDVQPDELEKETATPSQSELDRSPLKSDCSTTNYEIVTCRIISEAEVKNDGIQKHYTGSLLGPSCSTTTLVVVDCNDPPTDFYAKIGFKADGDSSKDIGVSSVEENAAEETRTQPPQKRKVKRFWLL